MLHRLKKLLPITCLCALAVGAAPASAGAKLVVGVSDNNFYMFAQPRFYKLGIPAARDMVVWNVAVQKNKSQLTAVRNWIALAKGDHVAPMISFAGNGNYVPTVAQYTTAIKAFIKDFPSVKTYTAWNEPDWIYRSLYRKPTLAAAYFNALVKACRGCTIVAGDVYRTGSALASWIRAYKRGLHYRPAAWALHPYDDVRTHTTSQIRTMEANTSGPIWLDEISGVETRGHWPYRNQGVGAANNDERFLFTLPKRFNRITRIYHYQWQAIKKAPWDSGLLGPLGAPRAAFYTFANAVHGKLP
jgi:hypothetical protein